MGALVAKVQSFSQLVFIRSDAPSGIVDFAASFLLPSSPLLFAFISLPRVTSSWRGFALYFSDFLLV